MWKVTPSKSLVIRINLVFLSCFLVIYAILLLRPSTTIYHENAASYIRCSLRDCHHKVETGYKMKAVLLEDPVELSRNRSNESSDRKMVKRERPSFLNASFIGRGMRIGMVNMEGEDLSDWTAIGKTIPVTFEKVSEYFEWKDLFPEWIDEEEEMHQTLCPEIPMPEYEKYGYMDMIVVNIPCNYPEEGWARDVYRLQLHLIAANMAVRRGRRSWSRKPKVVVLSKCRPMVEIFRCDDMLVHDGDWWYYQPDIKRLEQKVYLPVGTCSLALPLWGKGNDEVYDVEKLKKTNTRTKSRKREAYATVLHSSESYVCGAIMLAQTLLKTGTNRDLILLIDTSISIAKREALAAAGWTIRIIERIRNPRAEKNSYNEYNYSKFRLWQLTDYDKIIFIDSDIIVLRNLDIVFSFPQMSAVGNDNSIFNSGIMVIEPSNCTFMHFMQQTEEIISYNGGDQGFLNEIFVYWHRLPRRVNFLKNFWSNTTVETSMKNQLFGADPPKLYAIHYLGLKPWACYRDYDCNWDIGDQRVYASDVAHRTWWKIHDTMDASLQDHCKLTKQRKIELKWDRMQAGKIGFADEHWKINVTDPRRRG
ncbi:UDP-glucuronate:xylan alpha-glucuronosyltransferase 2-like isoform X1 [Bidens hawaiensis]|uniref:UDP-glucuronate:xylan alpha-glucuronosyltransferase 2-like isoform X1 n=2 Tax=Bidens hawaiensis TaxID=980011 RepID=UPI00404B4492